MRRRGPNVEFRGAALPPAVTADMERRPLERMVRYARAMPQPHQNMPLTLPKPGRNLKLGNHWTAAATTEATGVAEIPPSSR